MFLEKKRKAGKSKLNDFSSAFQDYRDSNARNKIINLPTSIVFP